MNVQEVQTTRTVVFVLSALLLGLPAVLAGDDGLTFFGWSDQHIRTDGNGAHLEPAIDAMNELPGTPYPAAIGGKVQTPAFVFGCGDITEWPTTAAKDTYHRLITKRLKFPAYDLAGNHDDGGKSPSPTVLNWIKSRHGALTYTFKKSGVHFLALHSKFDPDGPPYQPVSNEALEQMRRHLAGVPSGEPVVVATHLCYDAMTNRDDLIKAFGDANVVLILGGHYHKATVHAYRGHHFVQLPSPEPKSPNEVTVLRITSNRVVAVPFDYDRKEWTRDSRKILDARTRGPKPRQASKKPAALRAVTHNVHGFGPAARSAQLEHGPFAVPQIGTHPGPHH